LSDGLENPWLISSIILIVTILAIISIGYLAYMDLSEDYSRLLEDHLSLRSEHESLRAEYDSIEKELEELKAAYSELERAYSSLKEDYEELASSYQGLSEDLERSREELSRLSSLIDRISMRILLPTNLLPSMLSQSIEFGEKLMKDIGIKKGMPPSEKARRALEWIALNMQYLEDDYHLYLDDHALIAWENFLSLPNETLSRRGGDCEDLSILLYAILEASRDDEEVYVIGIRNVDSQHWAILYVTDLGYMIIDPAASYVTDARMGLSFMMKRDEKVFRVWLSPIQLHGDLKKELIEAGFAELHYYEVEGLAEEEAYRFLDLEKAIRSWIRYSWEALPGAYVCLIADETLALEFNSTEEFLEWME